MKARANNAFLPFVVVAALVLVLPRQVLAQTCTLVHTFTGLGGLYPYAGLILSGNTLYGTTYGNCVYNCGTIFKVNTDGTGFTNLYVFTALSNGNYGTNNDGANPQAGLILSGNALYGTTADGGRFGNGTVFKINTDGSGFVNLHSFTRPDGNTLTNSDGANPYAGLILSGNTLYGTASGGGSSGNGTVFAIDTDGTGFATLHSFTAFPPYPAAPTNSDGANLQAGLVLSGNTLYGAARGGGSAGNGTVFAVNTDGSGFVTLHQFTPMATTYYRNSDGASPWAGLMLSGSTLYGTAYQGGTGGNGTVFKVNTDGTGFVNLHNFTKLANTGNNSDGAGPYAGLILSGNTLYGTASIGGSFGGGIGTVFAVNTDGTGFTNLHSFTGGSDGANPLAALILSGNTLCGTTSAGGALGVGTVFSLSLRPSPSLTITRAGQDVILSWQTNFTGFTLQSTTNLVSPVWTTNLRAPVVINGQNTVTNPIYGTQQFFRLSQ